MFPIEAVPADTASPPLPLLLPLPAPQLGRSSPLAVVDLRFLRLLRVFRTFKLSGYGPQLELVVSAVRESKEMLMMFLINLMIVVRPACLFLPPSFLSITR